MCKREHGLEWDIFSRPQLGVLGVKLSKPRLELGVIVCVEGKKKAENKCLDKADANFE